MRCLLIIFVRYLVNLQRLEQEMQFDGVAWPYHCLQDALEKLSAAFRPGAEVGRLVLGGLKARTFHAVGVHLGFETCSKELGACPWV